MDVKIVSNLTSNLLVAKDDFEKQDGYLSKNIKVDGEDNLVMFRQNRDHLELINVTKNEMMLDKPIGNHDSKQPESTALQVYMEVKEKLNNLENKILMKVDEQLSNKPKAPEVKGDSKAEVSQFQSKAPELDKHQIIKEVRIQLKQEGKLGADFAKSANGLSVAHGDYIKLNEAYSQKDGLFKTTNLPKDAEIKITGHTTKKGETYATGVHNNSNVELKIRSVEARYGDQYVKRYETNPEVKQAVDQRVIAQQTTFKSLSASRVQELSQSSPKQDKPTSGMKF
ncbi:hypothetical protein RR32_19150 (plasmid) [Acinetobacter nosocomialis]|nr:hypothetical protein RU84_19115 [Acinetobacter baumannii]AJP36881.1 hypothetical protein RR32_19150 [Acinetobacter nosocomialis]OCZ12479.1 hypothetical protein BFR96_17415 [Acinetobacter pittii]ODL92207.1 hypothetical protein AXH22_07515 [Acinetobacter pittii]PKH29187.1 hypothetical protein BJF94_11975 [Acinetobacter radioresistens]